ncbi:hypothetical protein ACFPRL_20125 [Pseudoclavibacter helvolus]
MEPLPRRREAQREVAASTGGDGRPLARHQRAAASARGWHQAGEGAGRSPDRGRVDDAAAPAAQLHRPREEHPTAAGDAQVGDAAHHPRPGVRERPHRVRP